MDATTCPICDHQNLIDETDIVEITTNRIEVAKTCERCGTEYSLIFALVEKRTEPTSTQDDKTSDERKRAPVERLDRD